MSTYNINLKKVNYNKYTLRFKGEFKFKVTINADNIYIIEYPSIGMYVYGRDKIEIIQKLIDELEINWDRYIRNSQSYYLNEIEMIIRDNLMEIIEETNYSNNNAITYNY